MTTGFCGLRDRYLATIETALATTLFVSLIFLARELGRRQQTGERL